jgi:ribose transport system substrate-binding protein
VTSGFDAVLVCTAGDFEAMQNVYANALAKGTRVFQFNMPAELWPEDANLAISNIGYNNTMQAGYLAGNYMAEKLGGNGKIILIWGLPGHWSTARRKGLDLALANYPGMQIVGEQRGDYVRDKALNAALNLLQRDPEINAIYGENEEMALGAAQAISALGLKHWDGESGIITIGADGLRSGYEQIKEGAMTATVNVGPVDQGRQSIEAIFWNIVFGQVPPKVFNVRTQVVDKSNVDEPLAYVEWALGVPKI